MIPSRARRLRRALLLALGVALVATACSGTGGSASSASSSGGAPLVVGLTYTADIQFSPFYVAAEKGYFADEGLDVTLRHHGGSEPLLGALQAGDEDVVYAGGDEMMVNRSQGVDVVDVATIYQSYPGELIVPADSPITSLADLRGHSIGVPGEYGETWYTLLALLDEAGLSRDDVDIRTIGFTQQSALMTGKVDAVVGFSNNDAIQIRQAGTPVRTIQVADRIPLVGVSLVTTRSLLDSRRQDLETVVKASIKGMTAFVKDPDAAVEATKDHMDDLKVDQTQAKRAREVAVATGKLVSGDGSHPIGSVRVDDVAAMIEFLTSHKLLGDKKTPKAAEVCVPLGQ